MFRFRICKIQFSGEYDMVRSEYNKILHEDVFLIMTVPEVEKYCGR